MCNSRDDGAPDSHGKDSVRAPLEDASLGSAHSQNTFDVLFSVAHTNSFLQNVNSV
jgi:hypothetical protein